MEIILELSSQNCCEDKIQLIHAKLPAAGFLEKTESFTLRNPMHSTLPLLWGLVTLTSSVCLDVSFRQTLMSHWDTSTRRGPPSRSSGWNSCPLCKAERIGLKLVGGLQRGQNHGCKCWRWRRQGLAPQTSSLQNVSFRGHSSRATPLMLFFFLQLLSECLGCVLLFNNTI